MAWFSRSSAQIGPLERRVLDALWARGAAGSVRDLTPDFPDIAYTTLMTTLDRLHRKGLLNRTKSGRAFLYQPRLSRAEFESTRAGVALRHAIEGDQATIGPLLSYFVEAVGDRDRELLDELEALVRARRAALEEKR